MTEKLYRIKPLEWTVDEFGYLSAVVPFGCYEVLIEGAVTKPRFAWRHTGAGRQNCDSLEAGKSACEAHWRARLEAVLEEVPPWK